MAVRRHVTNKLRMAYRNASKRERGDILDTIITTTGMGRSTARRMLTGPPRPHPDEQVDRRKLRPKTYSDDARKLLEHVWALMGMPCGKYLTVMLPIWLPMLENAPTSDTVQTDAHLEDGERFSFGSLELTTVIAPGHTAGHAYSEDQAAGVIFHWRPGTAEHLTRHGARQGRRRRSAVRLCFGTASCDGL